MGFQDRKTWLGDAYGLDRRRESEKASTMVMPTTTGVSESITMRDGGGASTSALSKPSIFDTSTELISTNREKLASKEAMKKLIYSRKNKN